MELGCGTFHEPNVSLFWERYPEIAVNLVRYVRKLHTVYPRLARVRNPELSL